MKILYNNIMKKYIAIDYGEKRTGIALSDEAGMVFPYKVVNTFLIFKTIEELLSKEKYDGIIVGNPMIGKRKGMIEKFINSLKEMFNIEVIEWDESCTTKIADDYLRKIGEKAAKRRKKVDKIAACIILEEFLFSN
uniref:Putative pre-16S rRNA nuclease n=1 Tax=candidate division WOR-3 bacterium TaxID=2052148 RepID=A0A7C4UDC4_UNCW3